MFNNVTLIGNVGAEPDIREMNGGEKVANIRLATTERWKDKAGEKKESTEWHSVVVFDRLAGVVSAYVKKGDRLHVVGKLKTRKWQDKAGADRYSTEVVLSGPGAVLNMLSARGDAKAAPAEAKRIDDDIPF